MTRSLLIFVVTAIVVAGSYYGFSRFAATSGSAVSGTSPPLTAAINAGAAGTGTGTGTGAPTARAVGTANSPSSPTSASAPPQSAASPAAPATTSSAATPATAASAAAAGSTPASGTFSIVISKEHPPAPSDVIRVNKDDQVTLQITSDRVGHLEVHGYRKEVQVAPGTTATLSFAAVRTGRFPIDLHGSDGAHVEVTALEVLPR